jgi:hypothetical protein
MPNPAQEINKALENSLVSLTQLDDALTTYRDYEEDFPASLPKNVLNDLTNLQAVLPKTWEGVENLTGRRKIVELMERVALRIDSASVQTMLGSAAVELSGMLRTVEQVLKEKDSKKIEATGFESMKKHSK